MPSARWRISRSRKLSASADLTSRRGPVRLPVVGEKVEGKREMTARRHVPDRRTPTRSVLAVLLPIMAVVGVAYLVTGIAMPVLPIHVHQGLGLSTFVVG